MFLQMAQSLLNLHRMGYFHKSIKQVNWMTQPGFYSIPKLIDFGRAVYYQNKEDRLFLDAIGSDIRNLANTFKRVKNVFKSISQTEEMTMDIKKLHNTINDISYGLKGKKKSEG